MFDSAALAVYIYIYIYIGKDPLFDGDIYCARKWRR